MTHFSKYRWKKRNNSAVPLVCHTLNAAQSYESTSTKRSMNSSVSFENSKLPSGHTLRAATNESQRKSAAFCKQAACLARCAEGAKYINNAHARIYSPHSTRNLELFCFLFCPSELMRIECHLARFCFVYSHSRSRIFPRPIQWENAFLFIICTKTHMYFQF